MNDFMTYQPIGCSDGKVHSYEVIYNQVGRALHNQTDDNAVKTIVSFVNNVEISKIMRDKVAYLTFTPNILMRDMTMMFNKENLVIQVDGNLLLDPDTVNHIKKYVNAGFKVVMLNFQINKHFINILHLFSGLKIDFSLDRQELLDQLALAKRLKLDTFALGINSKKDKEEAISLGFDYFQGDSVGEIIRDAVVKKDAYLQTTFYALVVEVSKENPDYNEISKIISLDVNLTYSLLKLVNSAFFGLPNQVKNVKQAIAVFGINYIRQWIYLLGFSVKDDLSSELVKVSFTRGSFCQEIAKSIRNLPITHEEAYILGMFTTIDIVTGTDMESIMEGLRIDERIKRALIAGEGVCGDLVELCESYERADWVRVEELGESFNISNAKMTEIYSNVLTSVAHTWDLLGL